jgi:hypothetical protein
MFLSISFSSSLGQGFPNIDPQHIEMSAAASQYTFPYRADLHSITLEASLSVAR